MPVTAKLSQAFYDRLGHEVADEMVEWFNQVDTAYRHDLRELNELNFARFDAKMEQRLAEFRASLSEQMAQLSARLNERMSQLEVRLVEQMAQLATSLNERMSQLEVRFERRLGEQSRWLVGIWITVIGAAVALWFKR
jgi:hypothetical protein